MSVAINVNNVVKKFGDNVIIPGMSVKIKNGEFFTLLGPSGCGKTTLLRMIAGFNSIEDGEICFDDKAINDVPAHKRNIGMVFQSYAIFPHMTVRENVEYGLKLRKIEKDEIKSKVDNILDVVKIAEYQDRLPERLSGGQQQRVALARAIVIHPSVLLMDEPLSNLDAKLRLEMRSAIRDVQKKVGITTVYVTHDQEEALAISDRIAVINKGVIQQLGAPHDIYTRPYNQFVATFIGYSNLFRGRVRVENNKKIVVLKSGYEIEMDNLLDSVKDGESVMIAIRPEEFSIAEKGIEVEIKTSTFLGKYNTYEVEALKDEIVENMPALEFSQDIGHANRIYQVGEKIYLKPNSKKINIFSSDGEKSLIKGVEIYVE
ncbi:ABC transporter ATP-binding protein [Fusobacterium sp. SYSU M8D902]|uniref:ABC transporter ATP-binding protein n=1 Tax=Fusobacterium sp. SYSU M8D902 TaxID=3159562 RepID=UPI0032E3BA85